MELLIYLTCPNISIAADNAKTNIDIAIDTWIAISMLLDKLHIAPIIPPRTPATILIIIKGAITDLSIVPAARNIAIAPANASSNKDNEIATIIDLSKFLQ